MYLFFFNFIGLVMLIISFIALAAIHLVLEAMGLGVDTGPPNSYYILAASVFIIDLVYRHFRVRPRLDPASGNWLTTLRGGNLMLLPAWAFSIVGVILLAIFWDY